MLFRHATSNDTTVIVSLVNRSYRGESSRLGWTTEADLLSGKRIDEAGLSQLLNDSDSVVLIAHSEKSILATIHTHHEDNSVHFGFLLL